MAEHTTPLSVHRPLGEPRGGVAVLQEVFGVNGHIEDVCERFAREGWLAVAPHLYHCDGDPQLTYDDVPTALGYLANLTKEPVLEDFDAALCSITDTQIPSTKVGAVGFCMGGTLALVMVAERTIGAGVTFDGSDPVRRRRSRFHCDERELYHLEAATDAWRRTLAWFDRYL